MTSRRVPINDEVRHKELTGKFTDEISPQALSSWSLETGYCQGRVRVTVWVTVQVRDRVMVRVKMKWNIFYEMKCREVKLPTLNMSFKRTLSTKTWENLWVKRLRLNSRPSSLIKPRYWRREMIIRKDKRRSFSFSFLVDFPFYLLYCFVFQFFHLTF